MTLTPRLERYVRARFDDPRPVLERLRGWRISYEAQPPSERLTAAAVLVAERDGLDIAVALAEAEWRDLLVAARLDHEDWPRVLRRAFGD